MLRPRGLVEIVEFDFRCYDNDHKPILSTPDVMEPPWLPRWFNLSNMAVRQRGGTPDASNMLYAWLRQHPAFEDIVYREVWLPTSAFYQKGHKDFYAGTVMRKDIQVSVVAQRGVAHYCESCATHHTVQTSFFSSCRPFLSPGGRCYWEVGSRRRMSTN